jgi:hypothetical protein
MEDLSVDDDSARLLAATLGSGKPLGLVCHAPAALLATLDPNGSSPFAGYRLTGFTDAEEAQAGLAEKAKWLLQDRLVALGADFEEGQPWAEHIVVDRNLHTGQNPASSGPLADEMIKTRPSKARSVDSSGSVQRIPNRLNVGTLTKSSRRPNRTVAAPTAAVTSRESACISIPVGAEYLSNQVTLRVGTRE